MAKKRIGSFPWMNTPATRTVLAALAAAGVEVRFVGGCVRDAVLGRAVTDIDLATPALPERVKAALERAGVKAVPTGIDHGTVTAIAESTPFEITTLRRDVQTYGRRAEVVFTDDWEADAARRDFTFNAMSLSIEGELFDPFGGEIDARAGRVRFVGEPKTRIAEDHLRILRFFRLYGRYGKPPPDRVALEACAAQAASIETLSGERIRSEMMKLLAGPDPAGVLALMRDCGVLAVVLPGTAALESLAALVDLEQEEDEAGDPLRRLAALVRAGASPGPQATTVAGRWRLSRADAARLFALTEPSEDMPPTLAPADGRARLHRWGRQRFIDLVLLTWAERRAGLGVEPSAGAGYRTLLAEARAWEPRPFPLSGHDARRVGIAPGPLMGAVLKEIEEWWIAADFKPGRAECLAQLTTRVKQRPPGPRRRPRRR